jgi:hypothetical protein
VEAAPGAKYKAALSAAYSAGLRVCEVVALKVSDVDSERLLLRGSRALTARYTATVPVCSWLKTCARGARAAAVIAALLAAPALGSPIEPGAVRVIDGDTIEDRGAVFRLVGFDTPEAGSRAGCESERTLAAAASRRLRQLGMSARQAEQFADISAALDASIAKFLRLVISLELARQSTWTERPAAYGVQREPFLGLDQ